MDLIFFQQSFASSSLCTIHQFHHDFSLTFIMTLIDIHYQSHWSLALSVWCPVDTNIPRENDIESRRDWLLFFKDQKRGCTKSINTVKSRWLSNESKWLLACCVRIRLKSSENQCQVSTHPRIRRAT